MCLVFVKSIKSKHLSDGRVAFSLLLIQSELMFEDTIVSFSHSVSMQWFLPVMLIAVSCFANSFRKSLL